MHVNYTTFLHVLLQIHGMSCVMHDFLEFIYSYFFILFAVTFGASTLG